MSFLVEWNEISFPFSVMYILAVLVEIFNNLPEYTRYSLFFSPFIIAPAHSRVRYRSSTFRPSVHQGLSTINFSIPMISRIMKTCIVIVLDILYKHAP